jgi:ribose/xylose/arabinose/galactoside ABC-type transport system permease subunit
VKGARLNLVPLIAPTAFLAVLVGYALWLGGDFVAGDTRILDLHQNAPVLLIALGLVICLIAGQFDLSVASMATLTAFLSVGLMTKQGWPPAAAILACLVVAIAGGLFNSFLVVTLRVNAFIATLGSGGVFLGLAAVYSDGTSLIPDPAQDKAAMPSWFSGPESLTSFQTKAPTVVVIALIALLVGALAMTGFERARTARGRTLVLAGCGAVALGALAIFVVGDVGVPWTVALLLVVTFLLWVLLHYTTLGRHLYAVGGNSLAARLAGVKADRSTTFVFVMAAVLAGLAGIVLGGNQGAASPGGATPYLLPAFAAGFLSTVLFSDGRFHVWGTLLGGYLVIMVSQGLVTGGVPFTWNDVINGLVLIGAVAFQSYFSGDRGARRGRSRKRGTQAAEPEAEPEASSTG